MPDNQGRLFAEDVAAQIGITVGDWRARVSRKHAPRVTDRVVHDGAVRSVWDPQVIADYLAARQARLIGRRSEPLAISQATIDEVAAIQERDRIAGGPPWEVPDHPDHNLPGGWHRGQIR